MENLEVCPTDFSFFVLGLIVVCDFKLYEIFSIEKVIHYQIMKN